MNKLKKHKIAVSGCLVICVCIGLYLGLSGNLFGSKTTGSDIPEHDGEVLVDSANVKQDQAQNNDSDSDSKSKTKTVTSDEAAESSDSESDFEEMRATIDMDRNQVISMLTDTISQAETQQEKDNANKEKLKIINNMEKEQVVENLIKTKGLPQCLVLITDSGVNVTVNKKNLGQSDVAKICDIIMRETNKKASDIVIQSKV